MTYTGIVDAYGPADFRFLPGLLVAKMGLGPSGVNGYLLRCLRTEEQLLVDAADDALFVAAISSSRSLATIVTTHAHQEHTRALAHLYETTFADVLVHASEAADLPVAPARTVAHGDVVPVGEAALSVLHLPGHSPGSIGLLYEPADGSAPHLFSGDALLHGGAGSTSNDEDRQTLSEALQHRVFDVLPDETWVYPGHGLDTTVGRERVLAGALVGG